MLTFKQYLKETAFAASNFYTHWGFIDPAGKVIDGKKSDVNTHNALAKTLNLGGDLLATKKGYIGYSFANEAGGEHEFEAGFFLNVTKDKFKVLNNLSSFIAVRQNHMSKYKNFSFDVYTGPDPEQKISKLFHKLHEVTAFIDELKKKSLEDLQQQSIKECLEEGLKTPFYVSWGFIKPDGDVIEKSGGEQAAAGSHEVLAKTFGFSTKGEATRKGWVRWGIWGQVMWGDKKIMFFDYDLKACSPYTKNAMVVLADKYSARWNLIITDDEYSGKSGQFNKLEDFKKAVMR